MFFQSWLNALGFRTPSPRSRPTRRAIERRQRETRRLFLEELEDRRVFAFDAAANYPVGSSPQGIIAADFNNDLIQDLAVANYGSSSVSVLLGQADGTFQPALTSATGDNPLSLAVGDFDDDGILDLATANSANSDVSVLLGTNDGTGKGTGNFAAPTNIGIGSAPQSVAVGDFNNDGLLDLAATSNVYYPSSYYYYYYGHYEGQANVLLGNGNGGFSAPVASSLGYGFFTSALAANLDGAGGDEFVATNAYYGYYYGAVVILTDTGSGALQLSNSLYTGADAFNVTAGYLNGDNALDLVTSNGYYNSVSVLLSDGSGGFGAAQTYGVGNYPYAAAIGDFNHDSKPDIATANSSSNDLSVLYGRADGTFLPAVSAAAVTGPYALATGDFNGDTWLDVATANPNTNNVSVLLNDQDWPPAPATLSIGDATVTEVDSGTVAAEFTVTRSDNLAGTVTVNFGTASGSALASSDYVANSGTLTFGPNETTKTITILVNGDAIDEIDESFFVNLSDPSGANIDDGQGAGTITDNDLPPTITISDVSRNEGNNRHNTSFVFVVSLSQASEKTVDVDFETADGTATIADRDYVSAAGTIQIAPGAISKSITVTVRGDKGRESTESFFVNLTGAANGTIDDSQGVGTIVNDDGGKAKSSRLSSDGLVAALLADDELTASRKRK